MDLPIELKSAVENLVENKSMSELKAASKIITDKYRNESGKGKKLVTDKLDAEVYSVYRMPATFGACSDALSYVSEFYSESIDSVTDVGAGSGAASWASDIVFEPAKITCLEREKAMRDLGSKLMESDPSVSSKTTWSSFDITKDEIEESSDLVIASYMFNELDPDNIRSSIAKLWDKTDKLLVIIEPGTPKGFSVISTIRSYLLENNGYLVAPCTHNNPCRLSSDDWCHFTCRVQRSKLHKLLKDADVPYEDEKYSYIAFSKTPCDRAKMRVLRHPYITKGQVDVTLCTETENTKVTFRKRDGDLYKKAKKAKQGDNL